jgi:hypothetical protein
LELAVFFYQVAASRPKALLDELDWRDSQQQALEYARSALLKRPAWPYLWNELFQSKIKLKQFDNELTGAMERAVTLGPWEQSVQYDVAFTGLDNWDKLEMAARKWVIMALNKTIIMQPDPQPLVKEILAHANIGKLCLSVNEMPEYEMKMLAKYCKQPFPD